MLYATSCVTLLAMSTWPGGVGLGVTAPIVALLLGLGWLSVVAQTAERLGRTAVRSVLLARGASVVAFLAGVGPQLHLPPVLATAGLCLASFAGPAVVAVDLRWQNAELLGTDEPGRAGRRLTMLLALEPRSRRRRIVLRWLMSVSMTALATATIIVALA